MTSDGYGLLLKIEDLIRDGKYVDGFCEVKELINKVEALESDRMRLNVLRDEIHQMAVEKGWWAVKGDLDGLARTPLEIHALIHTEVAEATEEVRNGKPDCYCGDDGKPEGEAVELIDVIVRVLDYFGAKGWDADVIMREKIKYNKTRSFRHGNKAA